MFLILQITERIPVYIPERCPENMLLYPGQGDKSTWACDCKPKFLYFPSNNSCHEAYMQGPCPRGEYVTLPEDDVIPRCTINPCKENGLVLFCGFCYRLGCNEPCTANHTLNVNETTYTLECIKNYDETTYPPVKFQQFPEQLRGTLQ